MSFPESKAAYYVYMLKLLKFNKQFNKNCIVLKIVRFSSICLEGWLNYLINSITLWYVTVLIITYQMFGSLL